MTDGDLEAAASALEERGRCLAGEAKAFGEQSTIKRQEATVVYAASLAEAADLGEKAIGKWRESSMAWAEAAALWARKRMQAEKPDGIALGEVSVPHSSPPLSSAQPQPKRSD